MKKITILALLALLTSNIYAHIGVGLRSYQTGTKLSESHKNGLSYEIGTKGNFYNRFRANFNITYTSLNPLSDTVYKVFTDNSSSTPTTYNAKLVYGNMNILDFNIGGDFTPFIKKKLNPYVGFQAGLTSQSYDYEVFRYTFGGSNYVDESIVGLSLKAGFGLNYVINNRCFVDIDYRYHYELYENQESYTNSSIGLSFNYRFR